MKRAILIFFFLTTSAMAADPVLMFSFSNEKMEFSEDDISNANAQFSYESKLPIVVIRISEEKSKSFGPLTSRHIGETMDVSVCGEVVFSPRIMSAISGRYMQISGGFDLKSAQAIADRLKSGNCNQP